MCVLCFYKVPRKIVGQRGGWIYGLWAGAYPGFMLPTIPLPSTPREWAYYFLFVSSLFCGWLYDWDFLLVLPLDWRSQGEPGLAYCVHSSSSVSVTNFQMDCFHSYGCWELLIQMSGVILTSQKCEWRNEEWIITDLGYSLVVSH